MSRIILALVLVGIASTAAADMTAEFYKKMLSDPQQREFLKAYVSGVAAAYKSINVDIEVHNKGKPLYCPPDDLIITYQNYTDILESRLNEIAKMKEDMPFMSGYVALIEPELLRGLQKTFPCK
jgi:hypothetical protein